MSDRLALANAIEDAGVERGKAQRLASVIFDAIHDNVATKADVLALGSKLRVDFDPKFARQDVAIERLRATLREMESRITLRLSRCRCRRYCRLAAPVAIALRWSATPNVAAPRAVSTDQRPRHAPQARAQRLIARRASSAARSSSAPCTAA